MDINDKLDQAADEVTEGGNAAGGDDQTAIDANEGSTAAGDSLLGADAPAELKEKEKELMRAFHAKTQALAEDRKTLVAETEQYKQDALAFYNLSKQEWFKNAVASEKKLRSGQSAEITDEEYDAARNDKGAFSALLSKRDAALAASLKSQFGEEISKLAGTQTNLLKTQEERAALDKFGDDFSKAKKSGALDDYMREFGNMETAYKLWCQDNGKVAGKKPEPAKPEKPPLVLERGGLVNARGGTVVKVKTIDEAIDRAFELVGKGVKDWSFKKE